MADPERFVNELIKLGRHQDYQMVLMPAADYYVSLISKYAADLSGLFLFNIPEPSIIESIVNKSTQTELAKNNQIPAPTTFSPATIEELAAQKKALEFPVLVKGAVADVWQTVYKEKAFIANSLDELKQHYEQAARNNVRIVVQEIIQGPNRNHYKVCAYYSKEKKLLGIFSTQKTRQNPVDFGIGSYMTSEYHEELIRLARNFFEGIGYTGVGSIEFKRDERDGKFKLIELNPRFWQQNIQATIAGINFPDINYRDCLGIQVEPRLSFRDDVRWLDFWADLHSFRAQRKRSGLTLVEWLGAIFRSQSFAFYARDDFKPWMRQLTDRLRYYFRRFF